MSLPVGASGSSDVRSVCRIELLGVARLVADRESVTLALVQPAPLSQVVSALADACPALVGPVIDPGRRTLLEQYIVNRNGRDFLASPDALVRPGDRLLLVASVAGG
jgi:molybdopterin converting factor small subunit